jgi:hypothetical protein
VGQPGDRRVHIARNIRVRRKIWQRSSAWTNRSRCLMARLTAS